MSRTLIVSGAMLSAPLRFLAARRNIAAPSCAGMISAFAVPLPRSAARRPATNFVFGRETSNDRTMRSSLSFVFCERTEKRAVRRPAGPLLAPRLFSAATDLSASLGMRQRTAGVGFERHEHLMHQIGVPFLAEHRLPH